MFKTFINAFKIKEVRNKLFFTLMMLLIIRFGCQVTAPGVNREVLAEWASMFGAGAEGLGIINVFTGGSLMQWSIFALNITPYITSSIIMQLMTIAIPKLEEMQKEGEDGRKKIATITRYVTVGLALVESGAMAIGFGPQGLLEDFNALNVIAVMAAMTAGSTLLMWIGERINEKGVGNGISIILTINIISSFPTDVMTLYDKFIRGKSLALAVLAGVIIIAIIIAMIVMVIYLSNGVRKIPVQYAQKVQGNRMVGSNSSVIPVRVNTSGVIPVIFASSMLSFPLVISHMIKPEGFTNWWGEVLKYISQDNWFDPDHMIYSLGLLLYVGLVVFFAYFYTSISFNPIEMANNMKKRGGFIPGIRPGKPTSEYLENVLNRIIFIGAIGLIIVAVLPYVFNGVFGAQVSFGGTSIIIVVSVIVETAKQIESQMLVRNYKGFLND